MGQNMLKQFLITGTALLAITGAVAQENGEGDEDAEKTLSEFVEAFEKTDGLFPLYRDTETGAVYLEVSKDKLGEEFIYFLYTENGPVEAGHFRGFFRDNRVVTFNQVYDRIEIEAVHGA